MLSTIIKREIISIHKISILTLTVGDSVGDIEGAWDGLVVGCE